MQVQQRQHSTPRVVRAREGTFAEQNRFHSPVARPVPSALTRLFHSH